MEHRNRRPSLALALAAVLSLSGAASACGGGGGGARQAEETTAVEEAPRQVGPVAARGDNEVVARVGRSGGTLELANGARLEIPPGSLTTDVEVRFFVAPPAREAWDEETKRGLGPVLEVTPSISADSGAFTVSCPALQIPDGWTPSDSALGHEEESGQSMGGSTQTRWQMWPARIEGTRFVADMPALHGHRFQFGVSR